MGKGRLEAFSDGVIAIVITIMVLEMKVPHGDSLDALQPLVPVFLSYVLSFVYVAIYWSNHHHMLHMAGRVSARILWANLHLLFWLSLMPFATGWAGESHFSKVPSMAYGAVLFMASVAYQLLQNAIIASQGDGSRLRAAIGRDIKGRGSIVLYAAAIGAATVSNWISLAIYVLVALVWLVPDRRIERALVADPSASGTSMSEGRQTP